MTPWYLYFLEMLWIFQPVYPSETVGKVLVEDREMYTRKLCEPMCKFTRIFPPRWHSQQSTGYVQDNNNSLHPRSHSRSIVWLWRLTISRFSHVRQLIPLSLRLLDSALVVWIWRRAMAGGTMLFPCPTLLIKPIHKSKMLPTATSWNNEGLSGGTAAQAPSQQHEFVMFRVYTSHGSYFIIYYSDICVCIFAESKMICSSSFTTKSWLCPLILNWTPVICGGLEVGKLTWEIT